MKIILSRKGFDTSSGGCPSPLLPSGKLLSLPIPDKTSSIQYSQLVYEALNFGEIVSTLTNNRIKANFYAHLDPDLDSRNINREKDWSPIFGQSGSSQSHLQKMGVQIGDIFLFFGLFRETVFDGYNISWSLKSKAFHALWGWLQIGEILKVNNETVNRIPWAKNHPHIYNSERENNCIYKASDKLVIRDKQLSVAGAGTFASCNQKQVLTATNSNKVSVWNLPKWIYPSNNKKPLSFHGDNSRWQVDNDSVKLQTVGRGQEFVLDCDDYVEAYDWLVYLLEPGKV